MPGAVWVNIQVGGFHRSWAVFCDLLASGGFELMGLSARARDLREKVVRDIPRSRAAWAAGVFTSMRLRALRI